MNDVKLIIWDLDDTLWQGTLAEQDEVVLNQAVIKRIKFLLSRGIVHSICSKNDAEKAKKVLLKLGIYDLFIFPNIAFEDKGPRVKTIIKQTQLREQNVLFIDDNSFVLREIQFHNPKMMTKVIGEFIQEDVSTWGKPDDQWERLAQYKILEKKEISKTIFLDKMNDEHAFLKTCAIEIQMIPINMNDTDIERVIELVNRANQLNFTQSRIKYEYLFTLFELKNGINFKVQVNDKYGNYGIVGYVCILKNTLLHFVFSCRTLGMDIEARTLQWIKINYPEIKSSFKFSKIKNLAINLDFIQITVHTYNPENPSCLKNKRVLVRGPCLTNAISFFLHEQHQVDEEVFTFFEFANLNYLRKNISNKKEPRFNKTRKAIDTQHYSIIVNFLESDYFSGNYNIKNQLIPIASHYIFWKNLRSLNEDNPLLSEHIEAIMIDGMGDTKKFNLGTHFSPWPRLEKIANMVVNWFGLRGKKSLYQLILYFVFKNYGGYVSEKTFEKNVLWYISLFPTSTQLIFINPPEKITLPLLTRTQNKKVIHRAQTLNNIMRKIKKTRSNVVLLEMDEILEQEDIIDSFSHLKRKGYLKLSQALLEQVK